MDAAGFGPTSSEWVLLSAEAGDCGDTIDDALLSNSKAELLGVLSCVKNMARKSERRIERNTNQLRSQCKQALGQLPTTYLYVSFE